jgi:AmmeMemoRadiSam system protein A
MLTVLEHDLLLRVAREAINATAHRQPIPKLDLAGMPPTLTVQRTSFVTLTRYGELRGCIGGLEARMPLVADVQEHAIGAATQDPRFDPVTPNEVAELHIEISVLTPQESVTYATPEELLKILRPHIDGVTLVNGYRRATFLPQVWEKVPDPKTFLEMLSEKMGAQPETWRSAQTQVYRYQVEMFEEEISRKDAKSAK